MPETVANYLTIGADGTIGADFTGHVHAAGIDLDALIVGQTGFNLLRWIDQAERRWAYLYSQITELSPGVVQDATLGLQVEDPVAPNLASANMILDAGVEASPVASRSQISISVQDRDGGDFATLLDAAGRTDFLRTTGLRDARIAAGTAIPTWAGVVRTSGTLSVPLGMNTTGRTLAVALASRDPNFSFAVTPGITVTSFPLVGNRIDGAIPAVNTQVQCFWIAIAL